MRAVIQRVRQASVTVDGVVTGAIDGGLLVLLGVAPGDGPDQIAWLAPKVAQLRIFPDDAGRMDRSVADTGGGVLVVSQFTLYGDCRKGRRPSFVGAAPPEVAEPLYVRFCEALEAMGVPVGRGVFGAHMDVALVNDGPVTLVLDTP
ncbi:MAG: D-tyrosyl-tRNA(Tyr) deacylase [Alphaproteobacteria bacterium]|nr:D-tyrosyl-tRNA(Tyr) deacylase [Alphaproteobacteria bacterium]